MSMNRKTATKLLLVQWARFQNECIRLEGSTLLTGVNGSGKSTVLDAMTYLLTGNTQFNKAAKDRDRTVIGYVRGDTKSNGTERYLRTGEVISYIAMEFWSPLDQSFLVVGVCMESDNEIACRSSWFICRDARIDEINFTSTEGKRIRFTPKNELAVRGEKLRSAEFLGKERGVEQVLRALGLRCNASKYRSRLLKMMAFNPENNIDQFIQDCVLEPGRVDSLKELREQRHQFDHVKEMYENLRSSKAQLETIEQRTGEYERKLRSLRIRELMLLYQDLREKEEEKKQEEIRLEALKTKKERLEIRQKELDKRYKEAGERCRIAENNDIFRGVRESIQALERQIEKLNEEKEKQENGLALLMKLQAQISAILKWADPFIEVEEEDRNCLAHLSEGGRQIEEKLRSYLRFKEQMQGQKQIFWEEEIHCGDRIRELDQELDELETEIKQLKSNQMVFPKNAEAAKRIIYEELKQQGIQTDVDDGTADDAHHAVGCAALEAQLVVEHQGGGHPGGAVEDDPQIVHGVGEDGGGGAQEQRQGLQEDLAQHADEKACGQGSEKAGGSHVGGGFRVLLAQFPGDEVAAAVAEEEAHRLDNGHHGKHHAHGAGGAGAFQHTHEKGVRHIVEGGHQHADDTGQRQAADQPAHRGLGQFMKLLLLLAVHTLRLSAGCQAKK